MSDFDHAAVFATQSAPEAVVARLGTLADEQWRFRDWFTTRAIPMPGGPPRTPDLVAVLDKEDTLGEPVLLVHEFQSEHDPDKLETTLLEAAVFRAFARHGDGKGRYRVLVAVVYLQGTCPAPVLEMRTPSGAGTRHAPLLWEVAKDDAGEGLQAITEGKANWGTLFWIALMTGADQEGIIRRWRELVADKVTSSWMRDNLVGVALVFAELAGRFLLWERHLEGFGMLESQVANRWRAQGALATARAWLIEILQVKFKGSMTPDIKQLVEEQTILGTLEHWRKVALEADIWESFVQALR